jgi:glycosyltransferase involved in cell wall biosynthesis
MVAELILGSDPATVRHDLVTLDPPGPIVARLRAGSRWAAPLGGSGGLAGAARRLGRLLRAREYDVVNAYGLRASVAAGLLVRLLQPRAAFVCGVRGLHIIDVERLDSPKARLASLLELLLSPLVDVYDANSQAGLGVLAGIGIGADRLVHIPNGVDLSHWAPRNGDRADEPPLIVCAARFVALKRQRDLVEALAALWEDGVAFRAVLAGDGPTRPQIRELVSRLGLDGVVECPGRVPREEVHRLLGQATVACLPSATEGMPGTLMEAMASGVAVVATDVGGTSEVVVDGESGLLVPVHDPPALADAIGRLLSDHDLRARLATAGRRRMEERYSLEVMLDAKERLYRELASPRRAPSPRSRGS